jgi:Fur family iron response transcriptional regulator
MSDHVRLTTARGVPVHSDLAALLDSPSAPVKTGCGFHDVREILRAAGLRPTRQRLMLGWLLFSKGHRHVTAELLYTEATRAKAAVSLATVYNTLHQFTEAGLLRQLAVDGTKSYFDTNVSVHHHFFVEDDQVLIDIPNGMLPAGSLPAAPAELPAGMELVGVELIVRVRRKGRRAMARQSGEA